MNQKTRLHFASQPVQRRRILFLHNCYPEKGLFEPRQKNLFFFVSFENEKLAKNYEQLMRELGTLKSITGDVKNLFCLFLLKKGAK